MDLLLIHPTFPGQFRELLPCFLQAGHRVRAIGSNWPEPLPQWQQLGEFRYHQLSFEPGSEAEALDPDLEMGLRRAEAVAALAETWRAEGYAPDVIVAMSAWGDGLHLRELWPKAALVLYPELWASPRCLGYGFDPRLGSPAAPLLRSIDRQNLLALAAVLDGDAVVVPTQFQRDSFPPLLRCRLQVMHEGVNTIRACPDPAATFQVPEGPLLRHGDPIVSFASRTLEPLRGLRTFMEALPALLRAHPTVQVVIVGAPGGGGYGTASAHPEGHAMELLEELGERLDHQRLHFTGWLPHGQILQLFQLTAVHVYYTYPYTLSWSLLEAMACGAVVVGSRPGPLEEVIRDGENGLLLPFAEPAVLAARLLELLAQPERRRRLGDAARRTVIDLYNLEASSAAYLELFKALVASRASVPANR